MPGTSFKNYVVNYDLVVNSTASEGFAQVAQMAQRMQKPLKDLSNHFKRLQQSAAALKKGDAFEIKPTIDFSTFDKQSQTLITKAEQTAAKVNAILNGAFTINPAAAKDKSSGKGTKGATTPSKTETRTLTTKQLQKEAENVKKQLRDLYGPRGAMGAKSKSYKALVESLQSDVAKLSNFKALRAQLAAVNADIRTASKNGGKITKTITDGVAQGVVAGGKKGGKKLIQQPQVTEAFNSVLQGLVAGKAVQIPVSVVANAQTAESVNSALAKMRGQIKPIVIPITVATNVDAAKAVRETVQGLQNIITPSATGTKPVSGGKGKEKGKGKGATTPVVKSDEQKALEKELKGLQSEQNKYNFWKQKHDEWKNKVAAIQQGNATAQPTDAILQKAMEKVLYTDKGKKRLTPVSKPKLMSLTAAETAELNALTLATDPLIQQKTELESRLAALQKSAARKALTGKKFEEAKNIKQNLLPAINKQLEAAGEAHRTELLQKQAGYTRQYEADKKAYQQWQGKQEDYRKQLERESKALKRPAIQKKIDEVARGMMAVPTTKLPAEPKLAEGIRTPEQIEARRAEINQRLQSLGGTVAPITGKKGAARGSAAGTPKGLGLSIPIAQNLQQLQTLAGGRGINLNTRIVSTGQAGFDLNQNLVQLQNIANSHPIRLDTRIIPTGQAGFDLNIHIQKLQELALAHPIRLNTTLASNATGVKGGKGIAPLNTVPMEGLVENVVVSNAVKVSGGPVKVEGLVENVKMGKNGKPIEVKANLVAPTTNQLNNLRELSNIWKVLPKTGSRTYTVNLKMPGIENIGKLRELAGMVGTMPPSQRRVYNQGQSQAGGRGTGSQNMYVGRGPNMATRYAGRPRGTMNTFAYQLMGNTSLGARTPVFLDMMKGMGMMSGVGAAMSTLTNAFTNASEYQNTMVTAKSILEANYQGVDFNRDFGNMERIVRDVAKKTKFTAPQAADAARFMAMAGLNIPMINASIRPIADVAVIGDNDLGEVADKITNIQTAFGIQPNKMRALADALTKTFTSSNTDMMMLAESMEYAAPMAHLAGAQVEDALAMIGIMGNAGIQGSMAGTTLRMMYQNVINPNKKQQKMWNDLGISLKDAQGNPRQLIDILGDLRKKVRLSKDDKELDGTWKDEGTPIAEAVSRLFRVTASAGAGTLLENLDKVIALAEANRNAEGLSQRISEVKQNDVKGMFAKMTSAFTDAVVTEFESNESPIKGYLESLTKYFNSPDFKDMLHDIFDLVTSMLDALGKFARIWKSIYDTCGGLIKYVLMAQFWMTQIGYLFAPLRSVWMTIARGYGAMKGLTMGGAAMGAVGGAGAMGGTAAMAGGAAAMGSGARFYNNSAIQAARNTVAQFDKRLLNSQKYLAAATTANAATTPAIQRAMERKQMQWLVASNLVGSTAALRSHDNRSGRWNLAYTNPQAASELPTREKIMMAREKEVAALQRQLEARRSNIAGAQAAVLRNTSEGVAAHRNLNNQIAKVRHANRVVSPEVLERAVQKGVITRGRANLMSFQSGFRQVAGWSLTGVSMAGIASGFTSVVGMIGKALGFLLNPITIAAGAFIALGVAAWSAHKQMVKMNEDLQNEAKTFAEKTKEITKAFNEGDNLSSIFTGIKAISVDTATINVANENKNVAPPISADENLKNFYDAIVKNYELVKDGQRQGQYFLNRNIQDGTISEWYRSYVEPMIGKVPNLPTSLSDFRNRNGGGGWGAALGVVDVVRAIHGRHGYEAALEAQSEINRLYSELFGLSDEERIKATPEYTKRIQELLEQFNPSKKIWAKEVTKDNVLEMSRMLPTEDLAYYQAAYSSVQKYLTDSGISRAIEAYTTMKDNAPKQNDTNAWMDIIWKMARTMPVSFTDSSNKKHLINLPFDENGVLQRNQLTKTLHDLSVSLANPDASYIEALIGIYRQMVENIPGLKENIKDIGFSEEDFVKQSMNYGGQVKWGDNTKINKIIDSLYPHIPFMLPSSSDTSPYMIQQPSNTEYKMPLWFAPSALSQKDYMFSNNGSHQQIKPTAIYVKNEFTINPTMKEEIETEKLGNIVTDFFYKNAEQMYSGGYRWGQ